MRGLYEESREACDILLKLVNGGHVIGCNERAVGLTCELGAAGSGYVSVALAVRCCGELFEELKVSECGGIGSCCFA